MIDDESAKIVGGASGALVLAWVVRLFIRIYSSDRVQGHRERAEIDIIAALREETALLREHVRIERDRADAAEKDRNIAIEQTAQLRGEVASLKRDLAELEAQINVCKRRLAELAGSND